MTTPDNTKWLVGICAKVFLKDHISRSELIHLKDPSTGESRQYVLVQNKNDIRMLVEIQSLGADFSTFLLGRHIVKDGNLYVLNPVDPLFFVLRDCSTTISKQMSSWQPFDQTLECLVKGDEAVQQCIEESQLAHLCHTLCNDQTDNTTYFKFSESKTLAWLQKKQERVFECLMQQERVRAAKLKEYPSWKDHVGGSISDTFYLPDDPMAARPSSSKQSNELDVSSPKIVEKLRMESLQIVCNYLSDEWTDRLLSTVQVAFDDVFARAKAKGTTSADASQSPCSADTNVTPAATCTPMKKVVQKPKAVESSRSVANKRLEKVNKRGMSSLTSFFVPAKKKQATTK